ncbi:hypothetical protein LEH41_12480, partial [Salmonella enterica]|nr:hypothetical protein [Salmonella enterica]
KRLIVYNSLIYAGRPLKPGIACKFRHLALSPPSIPPSRALSLRSRTYGGDSILSKQYIAAYPEELPHE